MSRRALGSAQEQQDNRKDDAGCDLEGYQEAIPAVAEAVAATIGGINTEARVQQQPANGNAHTRHQQFAD